jgi:hypothetical protein
MYMRRAILILVFISLPVVAHAATQDCGSVMIAKILAGPRHGSMMQVNDVGCGGKSGWVCLDPEAQFMSAEKTQRLYSFVLSMYMAGKPVRLSVYRDQYAAACGNYPTVEDIRTP